MDFSTAAITFALFLTLVTAQVVTIAEGENGPTTLKTIYGRVRARVRAGARVGE